MSPPWRDQAARAFVERARRAEESTLPPGAEVRVWRGLQRQLRRRGRRLAWSMFFAGATSAALAVVLLLVLHRPRPDDVIATWRSPSGAAASIRAGETVAFDALALVDVRGVARLVAGQDTRARLERRPGGGVDVTLERGSVLARVQPRAPGAPFVVKTPRFDAVVVGTVLRVTVAADGAASVTVAHGTVDVLPSGGSAPLRVAGGQRWPAEARALPSPEELALLGDDREGVTLASFSPAADCGGDGAESLRCWLALAERGDAMRAESALYQAGTVAWRSLGDPRRALALWQEQRRRFPRGLLALEAQTSIIDALVALKRSAPATSELEQFLRQHPRDLRAAEMRFVLATLHRELDGDCRRAAPELRQALQQPGAPWSRRAEAALAACHTGR